MSKQARDQSSVISESVLTREGVRAQFAERGFSVSDLSHESLGRLADLVKSELDRAGLMKGTLRFQSILFSGAEVARIKVRAYYFRNREGITFHPDGFVGFCGWADDQNVQPFLQAFVKWMDQEGGAA